MLYKVTTVIIALTLLSLEAWLIKPFIRVNALALASTPVEVLPNILQITAAFNNGVAFSGLSHWQPALVLGLTGLLLCGLMVLWWATFPLWQGRRQCLLTSVAWGLVLGGALANWVDRWQWGSVTDYVQFSFWPQFAIMNLGDWGVSLGAMVLVVLSLRLQYKT